MSPYIVDRKRWASLTLFEQMGNIGSEVGRSIRANRIGDKASFESALARALDLFDATVGELVAKKSVRAREVLRAKDQYLQLFYGDNPDHIEARRLESYFMEFAVAARLRK